MEPKIVWHTSNRAISLGINRRPIIDVVFNGPMPALPEYEEAFAEYARIVSDGRPVVWLLDMRNFSPLDIDARTRKGAAEVFFRHERALKAASVAEARITKNKMTRFVLTAFDWLTNANKWPCQQFDTPAEAEAWLMGRYRERVPG